MPDYARHFNADAVMMDSCALTAQGFLSRHVLLGEEKIDQGRDVADVQVAVPIHVGCLGGERFAVHHLATEQMVDQAGDIADVDNPIVVGITQESGGRCRGNDKLAAIGEIQAIVVVVIEIVLVVAVKVALTKSDGVGRGLSRVTQSQKITVLSVIEEDIIQAFVVEEALTLEIDVAVLINHHAIHPVAQAKQVINNDKRVIGLIYINRHLHRVFLDCVWRSGIQRQHTTTACALAQRASNGIRACGINRFFNTATTQCMPYSESAKHL